MSESFRALVVSESQGTTSAELRRLTDEDLPDGDVTVAVEFSSLNYKDGLALTGRGRVVRRFPMVPGVDLAGTVVRSSSDAFAEGDRVLAAASESVTSAASRSALGCPANGSSPFPRR